MSDKPVILFFPFNLMSHYLRSLQVAILLKDHYDIYFKYSDKYAERLDQSGFKTFECRDLDAEEALEKVGKFDFSWLNANNLESVFKDQVKVMKERQPDWVIGDTSFTLKMAAESAGVKYMSILNGYSTRFYQIARELPPWHWIYPLISWLPDALRLPMLRTGEAWNFMLILRGFNKVRAKYKLNRSRHYLDELSGDSNIICDLPELFPQKKLPGNFQFVGPLFYQSDISSRAILEILDPEKKTILISVGSSREWERFNFLNSEEFSIYNIIVVGERENVLNASFLLKTSFVNFEEVLPRVDLVICHGGNGTISLALKHQVPVLCHQFHIEQTWNVQRIQEEGFGQTLSKVHPGRIFSVINYWIEKRSTIQWQLNFDAFNRDFQQNLLIKMLGSKDETSDQNIKE